MRGKKKLALIIALALLLACIVALRLRRDKPIGPRVSETSRLIGGPAFEVQVEMPAFNSGRAPWEIPGVILGFDHGPRFDQASPGARVGKIAADHLEFGADGMPTSWTITGTTTFGSKVNEAFQRNKTRATWLDSTGKGQASTKDSAIYVAQSGSPWSLQIYARALLKQPNLTMRALPAGTLKLEKGESLQVQGKGGPLTVTRYDLTGIQTDPDTYFVSAEAHERWRGALPYDAYPMRRIASIGLVNRP